MITGLKWRVLWFEKFKIIRLKLIYFYYKRCGRAQPFLCDKRNNLTKLQVNISRRVWTRTLGRIKCREMFLLCVLSLSLDFLSPFIVFRRTPPYSRVSLVFHTIVPLIHPNNVKTECKPPFYIFRHPCYHKQLKLGNKKTLHQLLLYKH